MDTPEKISINKLIRKYSGDNTFIVSLKKNLSSKYCSKVEFEGKSHKILSEKQYDVAKSILLN